MNYVSVGTLYKQIQTKGSFRDVTSSSVLVGRIQSSNKRLLFHDPKENIDGNSRVREPNCKEWLWCKIQVLNSFFGLISLVKLKCSETNCNVAAA
jgi:hypothetical protein